MNHRLCKLAAYTDFSGSARFEPDAMCFPVCKQTSRLFSVIMTGVPKVPFALGGDCYETCSRTDENEQ